MELYDFFYNELTTLKSRTGFNQWEKLNETADPKKEIDALIEFMIEECNKYPYNNVKPDVKQRVIHRAITEDSEFTGLNAKFVRRALNAWWQINGDRVMEKLQQHEFVPPPPLTPEQSKEIDRKLNEYIQSLLSGEGMQMVPKIEEREAKRRGREWTSNLEHRSAKHDNGLTEEQYLMRRRIQEEGGKFYRTRHSLNLKEFILEKQYRVMAETEADAIQIFNNAKL